MKPGILVLLRNGSNSFANQGRKRNVLTQIEN
jgi:hypothetical protein